MDLTVVLPAKGEGPNLKLLLPALRQVTSGLGLSTEILVITPAAAARWESGARGAGALGTQQATPGYGGALKRGFEAAAPDWILTMDADQSHRPDFVADIGPARH